MTVTQSSPTPTNHYPDCVFLELSWGRKHYPKVELKITINFNKQRQDILGGTVFYGLRSGELRLLLEGGSIPYEDREFMAELLPVIEKERTIGTRHESTAGRETQITANVDVDTGLLKSTTGATSKKTTNRGIEQSTSDKFKTLAFQVSTKGSLEEPAWVFSSNSGDTILLGGLSRERLAKVRVLGKQCKLTAKFEVSNSQIAITSVEGVFPDNLTANTRGVLRAVLLRFMREKRLGKIMSEMELYVNFAEQTLID